MYKNIVRTTGPNHPQKTFAVPQNYVSSPPNDITGDCGGATIASNSPALLKKNTTNKIDTDVNNDDYSQSFATEISDTKTTTTQATIHYHIYQQSTSTHKTSFKLPRSGK